LHIIVVASPDYLLGIGSQHSDAFASWRIAGDGYLLPNLGGSSISIW
jgi:hypothetical protein